MTKKKERKVGEVLNGLLEHLETVERTVVSELRYMKREAAWVVATLIKQAASGGT